MLGPSGASASTRGAGTSTWSASGQRVRIRGRCRGEEALWRAARGGHEGALARDVLLEELVAGAEGADQARPGRVGGDGRAGPRQQVLPARPQEHVALQVEEPVAVHVGVQREHRQPEAARRHEVREGGGLDWRGFEEGHGVGAEGRVQLGPLLHRWGLGVGPHPDPEQAQVHLPVIARDAQAGLRHGAAQLEQGRAEEALLHQRGTAGRKERERDEGELAHGYRPYPRPTSTRKVGRVTVSPAASGSCRASVVR